MQLQNLFLSAVTASVFFANPVEATPIQVATQLQESSDTTEVLLANHRHHHRHHTKKKFFKKFFKKKFYS